MYVQYARGITPGMSYCISKLAELSVASPLGYSIAVDRDVRDFFIQFDRDPLFTSLAVDMKTRVLAARAFCTVACGSAI